MLSPTRLLVIKLEASNTLNFSGKPVPRLVSVSPVATLSLDTALKEITHLMMSQLTA